MDTRITKKSIWGWFFYDWAAQPYNTLLITFIFGPYFASAVAPDAVQGQIMWGTMLSITGVCLALMAPFLGAIADSTGPRKPWIFAFSVMYFIGSFYLWFAVPGADNITLILIAFGIGMAGMELSQIFVNAILPSLGTRKELGRISGSGWAFGYFGGVLSLIFMLLLLAENDQGKTLIGISPIFGLDVSMREGTRSVGPFTAIWFFVFMIPFFLWVPDVEKQRTSFAAVKKGLSGLMQTVKSLPKNRSLFAYLASSMFYRDALNGLYGFGGLYASGVLGWSVVQIGTFGIVAAGAGAIFCYFGGYADSKFGPKRVIICSVIVLIIVCILVVGTSRTTFFGTELAANSKLPDNLFMMCGALIGAAGGILQAASRTFLVDQADPERMTEAYGLYALSGRATAFLAPALVTAATAITGNQRFGVSPLIFLFGVGLVLLLWVRSAEEYQ